MNPGRDFVEIVDGAIDFGAVLVEQLAAGNQVDGTAREVRSGAAENVRADVAQSRSRQQRLIQITLLTVECARRGYGMVQRVPQLGEACA